MLKKENLEKLKKKIENACEGSAHIKIKELPTAGAVVVMIKHGSANFGVTVIKNKDGTYLITDEGDIFSQMLDGMNPDEYQDAFDDLKNMATDNDLDAELYTDDIGDGEAEVKTEAAADSVPDAIANFVDLASSALEDNT